MIAHHKEFLRRVMKGCLLSRKVKLLRNLIDLKVVAHHFALTSARLAADSDSAVLPSPAGPGDPPVPSPAVPGPRGPRSGLQKADSNCVCGGCALAPIPA